MRLAWQSWPPRSPPAASSGSPRWSRPSRRPARGHEFLMVDHDAEGAALVAFALDTGEDCHDGPHPGRGAQCVHVLRVASSGEG